MTTVARRKLGFTLLELVVVMLLLGLSFAGLAKLLANISLMYTSGQSRAALLEQGRFVLERISREVRAATPNSVRVSNSVTYSCLEFMPFQAAGRYRLLTLAPEQSNTLDVVVLRTPFMPLAGQWLVVYPQTAADLYQQPAPVGQGRRVQLATPATVDDADGISQTYRLQLAQNFGFTAASPVNRFYLLEQPVSFCAQNNGIWRYQGYSVQTDQPVPGAGLTGGEQLAADISNDLATQPVFTLAPPTLSRNSLIQLDLLLRSNLDPDVTLDHSYLLQVNNVP